MVTALRSEEGLWTNGIGPNRLNHMQKRVMLKRPPCCAARLEQTASLPGAARHTLLAF